MKKIVLAIIAVLFLTIFLAFKIHKDSKTQKVISPKPRNGVAVILTGASARIPQEAALLEELNERGLLKNLVFISGVSSGALNSVALNGILSKKMTWDEYRNILYNLKNSDVFTQEGKKIPVNTSPARALYKKIFEEKLGYFRIGDLPFVTSISFTHLEDLDLKKNVYRMCSRKINKETDTTLSLVDIVMASSAFPIVFPPVKIENVKTIPDVEYVDGGVGEDHVPYYALLEFEKYRGVGVEKVFIISRKTDNIPEISEELKMLGINDKGIFDKLGISFDAILNKQIIKRLEAYANEAPELVPLTYVWKPDFENDFLLFNFDNLKEQYILTSQWAKTHDPIPLEDFLLSYRSNKK
jgi:predicted acylesterase/phospholipase RssA